MASLHETTTLVRVIVVRGDEPAREVFCGDVLYTAAGRLLSEVEATVSECSACGGPWTDCTEDCAND